MRLELSRAKQEYEAVLKKKKEGGKLSETEKQQEKENYIEEAYNNLVNIMK